MLGSSGLQVRDKLNSLLVRSHSIARARARAFMLRKEGVAEGGMWWEATREGVPIHEESPTPKVVLKIGNKMCDRTESKVVKRQHEMR